MLEGSTAATCAWDRHDAENGDEGSSNDAEEARRAASILHQTPGWRRRRELCVTERTQQCQSGPTTKAWFRDRCNRVDSDACGRGNVATGVRETVWGRAERIVRAAWKGWRVRVAPPGPCRSRNEIRVDVDSALARIWQNRVALPGDTRAAPPGNVQAAPSGRVWSATLKLDRPIVRVLPVHNDAGVSWCEA